MVVLTIGLLAAGILITPQAVAAPGEVGDASLWRTSPKCDGPGEAVVAATEVRPDRSSTGLSARTPPGARTDRRRVWSCRNGSR